MTDERDPRLINWEEALKNRVEGKQHSRRKRAHERNPGPDSCYALTGGVNRFGHPCLTPGLPKYGMGCWRHPQEPDPNYEEPEPERPDRPHGKGGRRWRELKQMMEETGVSLEDFVRQLSPEELARGQLKNEEGKFIGAPPKWVPRVFMQACTSEILRRGRELYTESYVDAIKVMLSLAMGEDNEGAVRLRAAQFVIERIEGKVPDKVIVESRDSFDVRREELEAALAENDQIQRVKERLQGMVPGEAATG